MCCYETELRIKSNFSLSCGLLTWVSGSFGPMLAAPSFTTSVSCVIVRAEDCAARASFSWPDAAPATKFLVSSTRALAVFRIFSLRDAHSSEQSDLQFHHPEVSVSALPVVSKRVRVRFSVQSAGWSEHDGGVQVSNDAGHSTGCSDACLSTLTASLQSWQNHGDLRHTERKTSE